MGYKEATKMPSMVPGRRTVTSDRFQMFENECRKTSQVWLWSVSTAEDGAVVEGFQAVGQLPNKGRTKHSSCCCFLRLGSHDSASRPAEATMLPSIT
jgi:hypothetical protein